MGQHIKMINAIFIKHSGRKMIFFGIYANTCFNRIIMPARPKPFGREYIPTFVKILSPNLIQY